MLMDPGRWIYLNIYLRYSIVKTSVIAVSSGWGHLQPGWYV